MTELPFRKPPRIPTEGLIHAGGPIDKVCIGLRIFGDNLDPDKITSKLGASPTYSCRKGDVFRGKRKQYDRIEKQGRWHYSKPNSPVEIDHQVVSILNELNDDTQVWRDLTSEFKVDLFLGVFMDTWNRGFGLTAPTLKMLADRRLSIGFDIYANAGV